MSAIQIKCLIARSVLLLKAEALHYKCTLCFNLVQNLEWGDRVCTYLSFLMQ